MRIYRMTGLAAACGLLLVTTAPAQRSAELAKPVQVHAGGAPIDTGTDIGYAGPLSIEWEDSGMEREFGAREACEFTKRLDFTPGKIAFDAAFED